MLFPAFGVSTCSKPGDGPRPKKDICFGLAGHIRHLYCPPLPVNRFHHQEYEVSIPQGLDPLALSFVRGFLRTDMTTGYRNLLFFICDSFRFKTSLQYLEPQMQRGSSIRTGAFQCWDGILCIKEALQYNGFYLKPENFKQSLVKSRKC
ncbi:hypothetical protein Avbf_17260 [Armadillidium vulgare]|nr:hypothetical protein Avbf_17260 [Armadillidium vulgare]